MRRLFFLFVFLFLSPFVFAQDYIHTLGSEEIKVKVLEVKTEVITYKKFNNLDGPTFEIPKSEVHKIVFKNGEEEFFNVLQKDGLIGISFTFFINDTLFITNVMDPSPAKYAGLTVGDKIVRISNTRIGNFKTNEKVQNLLTGAPNSTVDIEVIKVNTNQRTVVSVQRKRLEDFNFYSNNVIPSNNGTVLQAPVSNTVQENTVKDYDVQNGFFGSFTFGIGGASFPALEQFSLNYEFEIGRVLPKSNVLNSFKFMIMQFVDDEIDLYSMKYSCVGYFGKYTKQGFFTGADFGMVIYSRGDVPLWDLALVLGYSFRVHRNIRIEIPGSVNLLPTANFSNLAVGGYIGVRLSGIL